MATRIRPRPALLVVVLVALLTALLTALAACSTSTSGTPQAGTDRPHDATPSARTTPSGPTSFPTSGSTSSGTAPSDSASSGPSATNAPLITVRGSDGTEYRAKVFAQSRVTDCAAHSYGAPIIEYFRQHPCTGAVRRLFGVVFHGRVVVMSAVTVTCARGPGSDYYKWTGLLASLERSSGTGSVNDLLREGVRLRGLPDAIPFREAFGVYAQDTVVLVADAWYLTGTTRDQDPQLLALEQNLFPSVLTNP